MPQQQVVAAVAVEVADAGHLPAGVEAVSRNRMVAEEASIGLAEPVGDRAIVVPKQQVVATVAIEVAHSGHVPAGGQRIARRRMVAEEAAVRLPEPVGDRAVVMPKQQVAAPVAVEVAGARYLPGGGEPVGGDRVVAEEPSIGLTQPFGNRAI